MYKKITLFQKLMVLAWLFGVVALFASFLNSQNVYSRKLNYNAGLVTRQQTEAMTWKSDQLFAAILSGKAIDASAIAVTVVANPAQQIINKILMGIAQAVFKFVLSQLQKIADMIMNFLEGITDMFNKLVGVISGAVVWLQSLLRTNVNLCKDIDKSVAQITSLTGLAYAKSPLEYAFSNSVGDVNQSNTGMLANNVFKNAKYAWGSVTNSGSVTARADAFGTAVDEVKNVLKTDAREFVGAGLNAAFCSKENKVIHTGETAVAAAKKEEDFAIAQGIELGGETKVKQMVKAYYNTALPVVANGSVGFSGSLTQSKAIDAAAAKIGNVVEATTAVVRDGDLSRINQLPNIGLFSGLVIQDSAKLSSAETKAQVKDLTEKIALTAKDAKVGVMDPRTGKGDKMAVLSTDKCEASKLPKLTNDTVIIADSSSNVAVNSNPSFLDSIQVNALDFNAVTGTNIAPMKLAVPGGTVGDVLLKEVNTCETEVRTPKEDQKLKEEKSVSAQVPKPVEQAQPSLQSLFQDFIAKVVEIGQKLIDAAMKIWNKIVSTFQEILSIVNNAGSALGSLLNGGASGGQILGVLANGLGAAKDALGTKAGTDSTSIAQNGVIPSQFPLGAYKNVQPGETVTFNPLTDGGAGVNVGGAKIIKIYGQDVTAGSKIKIPFGGVGREIEVTLLGNSQEMQFSVPRDGGNDANGDPLPPLPLGPVVYKVSVEGVNKLVSETTIYINITKSGDEVAI